MRKRLEWLFVVRIEVARVAGALRMRDVRRGHLQRHPPTQYYSVSNSSKIVRNRATLTTADQQKVVHDLSNCTVLSECLERLLTQFSAPRHSLTLKLYKIHIGLYNGILIGTYTRPSEGCHFAWPWVTERNIQWHEASSGLSATAELLVIARIDTVILSVCLSVCHSPLLSSA